MQTLHHCIYRSWASLSLMSVGILDHPICIDTQEALHCVSGDSQRPSDAKFDLHTGLEPYLLQAVQWRYLFLKVLCNIFKVWNFIVYVKVFTSKCGSNPTGFGSCQSMGFFPDKLEVGSSWLLHQSFFSTYVHDSAEFPEFRLTPAGPFWCWTLDSCLLLEHLSALSY